MDFDSIKKLVCDCKFVEIEYRYNGQNRKVYAECGWYSLTGSIKDRVAWQILKDAYENGSLKKGDGIVEVSSGNMGISLVAIANLTGNPTIIIMPKSMSVERKKLLKMYGATLVEVEDFKEAFQLCNYYENNGYFCTHQFDNLSNEKAHYEITGKNILKKITNIKSFVAGVGTSGTLMGVGRRLKELSGCVEIVAIEPEKARIISGGELQHHKLQGLSDEVLPGLYNESIVDRVIQISDNDAIAMAQKLNGELSLGVGISAGANFLGCVLAGDNSVTILADDNKKYISTDLSQRITTDLVDRVELLKVKYI